MDLGHMNVGLKLMYLYVGSVFKTWNVVLNVLTIWPKSGPFPRVFWMIRFSTFWGVRQAEGLQPRSHHVPLAARQSSYGFASKSPFFFIFPDFSLW